MATLPTTVAAVDLGSNSFHMVVARLTGGAITVLDRRRESVRLAAGIDENGRLGREASERALECLGRFGQRLRHLSHDSVRAVGTNTLRRARREGSFLRKAQARLGHPVEVISGIEEARLIYLGVTASLAGAGRRLVLDIGGGSTEVIVGEGVEPREMESLYVGCVGMSLRYFPEGRVRRKAWRRAELEAMQEFEPIAERYRGLGWGEAVGSSGTVRATANVIDAAGWGSGGITPEGLERIKAALLDAGSSTSSRLEGLSAERAPVFPGGVVVLLAAFRSLGIERLRVAQGALREGVLEDLIGRLQRRDRRQRSVRALARRYHVDPEQARRVALTARKLLHQVARAWGIEGDQAEKLIGWAAELHEIGLDIAHAGYHKHGAYVISNANLYGFSLQEQRVVAALVRCQRRKLRSSVFDDLQGDWRRTTKRLAVLLRIAVALHRDRRPKGPPPFEASANEKELVLTFPEGWLDQSPLTRADLQAAAKSLDVVGVRLSVRERPVEGDVARSSGPQPSTSPTVAPSTSAAAGGGSSPEESSTG